MGQSEIIPTLGKAVALVGAIVTVGYLLKMLAVFLQGLQLAQSGASTSELVPYLTALIMLMVAASIPVWLDIDIPA